MKTQSARRRSLLIRLSAVLGMLAAMPAGAAGTASSASAGTGTYPAYWAAPAPMDSAFDSRGEYTPTVAGPAGNRGVPGNSAQLPGDFNADGRADVGAFYDYGSSTASLFEFPGGPSGVTSPASVRSSGYGNWAWSHILTG
ncbi:hypothetical protein [Streptomyces sp. IBSBF 2435]|uniref:hypothetical protein n=1 Tax=Streptomyces sp. IBSBF 2435 TaxID=2903531 RepID=UPI002FDC3D6F